MHLESVVVDKKHAVHVAKVAPQRFYGVPSLAAGRAVLNWRLARVRAMQHLHGPHHGPLLAQCGNMATLPYPILPPAASDREEAL